MDYKERQTYGENCIRNPESGYEIIERRESGIDVAIFQFKPSSPHTLEVDSYFDDNRGWGCGYVFIPKSHSAFGKFYSDLNSEYEFDVDWGLTWSSIVEMNDGTEKWVIGFDTAHLYNTKTNRPKEWVIERAINMAKILENNMELD